MNFNSDLIINKIIPARIEAVKTKNIFKHIKQSLKIVKKVF